MDSQEVEKSSLSADQLASVGSTAMDQAADRSKDGEQETAEDITKQVGVASFLMQEPSSETISTV